MMMEMQHDKFHGYRLSNGECFVSLISTYIRKTQYELPLRLDLRNHSPTGFEWGYGGSGPSQLALAMLAYATDDHTALDLYQMFKQACVGRLPASRWKVRIDDVRNWAKDPSPRGWRSYPRSREKGYFAVIPPSNSSQKG
ncbi:MAG: DUF6166 domain-containing protein [Gemmatimonadetes bacterium]|nr:DUF6166 domain-containing protein [Gemmatimonadota bacterium]